MYYDRGDLPIKMEYLTGGEKISWLADINKLDYSLYLPLFFDGLSEIKHPYKTYARQGVRDLLNSGGDKIHSVIPQLIIPIKSRYTYGTYDKRGQQHFSARPSTVSLKEMKKKNRHQLLSFKIVIADSEIKVRFPQDFLLFFFLLQ